MVESGVSEQVAWEAGPADAGLLGWRRFRIHRRVSELWWLFVQTIHVIVDCGLGSGGCVSVPAVCGSAGVRTTSSEAEEDDENDDCCRDNESQYEGDPNCRSSR